MLKGFSKTWIFSLRLGGGLAICSFVLLYTSIVLSGLVKKYLVNSTNNIWSFPGSVEQAWVLWLVFVLSVSIGMVLLNRLLKYVYTTPLTKRVGFILEQDVSVGASNAGVSINKVLLISPFVSGALLYQLSGGKGAALMHFLFVTDAKLTTEGSALWLDHGVVVLAYCLLAVPIHVMVVKQLLPPEDPFSY